MPSDRSQLSRVLIVDDDCVMRGVASSFFSQQGVSEVLEADDGEKALRLIEDYQSQIDFVLCDLKMPNMDGFQFLRHLNQHNYKGAIAILSGFEETIIKLARDLAENHNLRIVGALQKPLDFNTLANIYQFLVDQQLDKDEDRLFELLGEDLEKAVLSRSLLTYYQPKISLASGHIQGAEAITYWDHHIYGMLTSDQYMGLAKDHGLVHNLETLQLEQIFRDLKAAGTLGGSFRISLNIDIDMLDNPDFPELIALMVGGYDANLSQLTLEIRADQITNNTNLLEILARMRMHGVEFALDHADVSTSNLEQISRLPFSELKLDKSIVKDAHSSPLAQEHIKSYIQFGKNRKMQVTGLGAETPNDLQYLASQGADFVQGYFPAKPMPLDAMVQWIIEYESRFRVNKN